MEKPQEGCFRRTSPCKYYLFPGVPPFIKPQKSPPNLTWHHHGLLNSCIPLTQPILVQSDPWRTLGNIFCLKGAIEMQVITSTALWTVPGSISSPLAPARDHQEIPWAKTPALFSSCTKRCYFSHLRKQSSPTYFLQKLLLLSLLQQKFYIYNIKLDCAFVVCVMGRQVLSTLPSYPCRLPRWHRPQFPWPNSDLPANISLLGGL